MFRIIGIGCSSSLKIRDGVAEVKLMMFSKYCVNVILLIRDMRGHNFIPCVPVLFSWLGAECCETDLILNSCGFPAGACLARACCGTVATFSRR